MRSRTNSSQAGKQAIRVQAIEVLLLTCCVIAPGKGFVSLPQLKVRGEHITFGADLFDVRGAAVA